MSIPARYIISHAGCSEIRGVVSLMNGADYQRFILRLSERVEQYNIRLYMFVGIATGDLLKYSDLTQRRVAQQLHVKSGSTVSKQIVRSCEIIMDNGELSCQVEKCEEILREMRRVEQILND